MINTTNNQQRTLFKTKPNKAKVNIGKIDRMQKFTRRRPDKSLSAVGGAHSGFYPSSLWVSMPQCLCGYEPIIQNKANFRKDEYRGGGKKNNGYPEPSIDLTKAYILRPIQIRPRIKHKNPKILNTVAIKASS